MNILVLLFIVFILVVIVVCLGWRFCSRKKSLPCPVWMIWLLDPPFFTKRTQNTVSLLNLSPGMKVLDAGCGPGRLSIPVAREIGPDGVVTAMDLQEGMISTVRSRAEKANISNIRYLNGGIGEGKLEKEYYDRVILITVLGEIPDRDRAMDEIFHALRPGGILLIEETIRDPHFQTQATVRQIAALYGFVEMSCTGSRFTYTMLLQRPAF